MKYNFDEIIKRRNSDCIKWDHMYLMDERADNTTLPMWVADMEFKVAQEIIDDLTLRAQHGIYGYTRGGQDYYDAIINWYEKRFNWSIKQDSILHAPGIVPALGFLVDALSQENDGIIIQPPVYYPFANIIKAHNRKLIANELINNEGYYTIDFDDLKQKASEPNNKVMIFCSPHNPVGRVWTKEEIKKVIEICQKTNTYLIIDEIHCDLLRRGQVHYPAFAITDDTSYMVSCIAPSKTFNMPGLQMSVIVIEDSQVKEAYFHVMNDKYASANLSSFGLVGARSAYQNGEEWLEQLIDYLDDNFKYMDEYVKENLPKAKFRIPEGTYLAWLNLEEYKDIELIMEELITKEKLFIENGKVFSEGVVNGYFRMNLACPRSQLKEALEKIKKVVD